MYDAKKSLERIIELNSDDLKLRDIFIKLVIANEHLLSHCVGDTHNILDCAEDIELSDKIRELCGEYKLDFNVVSGYFRIFIALSAFNP